MIAMSKIIILWITIFAVVGGPVAVYASEQSPYNSGYNHGCDDASESPSDRYINEEGKGKSHHTPDFNRGYDAGFNSCSGGSSGGSSNSGESDGEKLCRLVDENRAAAAVLAVALGFPGLDVAVNALCDN